MEESKFGRKEMQKQRWERQAYQEKIGRGEKHYKMHESIQGGQKQNKAWHVKGRGRTGKSEKRQNP